MPKLNVYDMNGKSIDEIAVNEDIFGIEPNKAVLHEVMVAELAARRSGTASTKTRAMVRGGGRKPWRQKGTGRARAGSNTSPIWVGGGVTFGPHPRSYKKKVNKKVRKLAIKSALSEKVNEGNVIIVDEFNFDNPKTKKMADFNKAVEASKPLLIINDLLEDKDWITYLSARNIKDQMILQVNELEVHGLLKQNKVVITKKALEEIEEVLG
ncbi:MAG: 50S ribosomal protein L4 [Fusobacteriota bacterium]